MLVGSRLWTGSFLFFKAFEASYWESKNLYNSDHLKTKWQLQHLKIRVREKMNREKCWGLVFVVMVVPYRFSPIFYYENFPKKLKELYSENPWGCQIPWLTFCPIHFITSLSTHQPSDFWMHFKLWMVFVLNFCCRYCGSNTVVKIKLESNQTKKWKSPVITHPEVTFGDSL